MACPKFRGREDGVLAASSPLSPVIRWSTFGANNVTSLSLVSGVSQEPTVNPTLAKPALAVA
ncbi:hypothetical protein D8I24_3408 [Cupriavidus necator H850]|nr:hypothetical protein D8I24_3408 [Cupriavidus necator H850]